MLQRALIISTAFLLVACGGPLPILEGVCGPPEPDAAPVCRQVTRPRRTLAEGPVAVRVDARCHWNHTGLELQPGMKYRIKVKEPAIEPWQDWFNPSDPRTGWTRHTWYEPAVRLFARANKVPMYALVAVEGQDTGDYFPALAGDRVATGKGELLLFANDWHSRYKNNLGCLDVTVERVRN